MDALELVVEAILQGDRLLRELHPRGVCRKGVNGTVAGRERAASARQQQPRLQPHLSSSWWRYKVE